MKISADQRKLIQKLRSEGQTYAEIREHIGVPVPQGSLSYICRNIVLSPEYYAKIKSLNSLHLQSARQKALQRNREIRGALLAEIEKGVSDVFSNVDGNTLKIALAMLYLGEGSKWRSFRGLSLGSSDPEIVRTYIALLRICYGIPLGKMRARIQCRADQDMAALLKYWSMVASLPASQFYKTYADRRTVGKPTKRDDYRGVCVIICSGTKIQLELAIIAKLLLKYVGL